MIVHDYQLSLAIGKEGQNARLAARLTGWRIDIKSETQLAEEESGYASEDWAEGEWITERGRRDGLAAGRRRRSGLGRGVGPGRRGADAGPTTQARRRHDAAGGARARG